MDSKQKKIMRGGLASRMSSPLEFGPSNDHSCTRYVRIIDTNRVEHMIPFYSDDQTISDLYESYRELVQEEEEIIFLKIGTERAPKKNLSIVHYLQGWDINKPLFEAQHFSMQEEYTEEAYHGSHLGTFHVEVFYADEGKSIIVKGMKHTDTIYTLKQHLFEEIEVKPDLQILFLNSQQLNDFMTLGHYGINAETLLTLICIDASKKLLVDINARGQSLKYDLDPALKIKDIKLYIGKQLHNNLQDLYLTDGQTILNDDTLISSISKTRIQLATRRGKDSNMFMHLRIKHNQKKLLPYQAYREVSVSQIVEKHVRNSTGVQNLYSLVYGEVILHGKDKLMQIEQSESFKRLQKDEIFEVMVVACGGKILLSKFIANQQIKGQMMDFSCTNDSTLSKKIKESKLRKMGPAIPAYTADNPAYFRQVNTGISKFLSKDQRELKADQVFQLYRSLVQDLCKLPNHYGLVHRGSDHPYRETFQKVGQIVSFSKFESASQEQEVAQCFNGGSLIHIQSRTGKAIHQFSLIPDEKEIIFLPFTYFRVQKIKHNVMRYGKSFDQFWVTEIPSPEKFSHTIVLWVDDEPENNVSAISAYKKKFPQMEFIQLSSTKVAEDWVKEFGWLFHFKKLHLKVITDMVRYEGIDQEKKANYYAAIDLIASLYQTYGLPVKVLVYCGNRNQGWQNIREKGLREQFIYDVVDDDSLIEQYIKNYKPRPF